MKTDTSDATKIFSLNRTWFHGKKVLYPNPWSTEEPRAPFPSPLTEPPVTTEARLCPSRRTQMAHGHDGRPSKKDELRATGPRWGSKRTGGPFI